MNKLKRFVHVGFVLVMSIVFIISSLFRLNEYYSFETLQGQIEAGYQVVYIDPTYLINFIALLLFPPSYWYFWKVRFYDKKSAATALKAVIVVTVVSLLVAFPGQFWEHQRLRQVAISHGYSDCPPFTLLSSAHIVEAMVKEPRYCTDREANKISKYGYYRELPLVNEYINSAYGSIETK